MHEYMIRIRTVRQNKHHLVLLNLLRGIAILWIVSFHMIKDFNDYFCSGSGFLSDLFCKVILHGAFGVDFFVIISGYVLSISVSQKEIDWSLFMKKRFLRIFPLYWIALLSVLLVEISVGSNKENFQLLSILLHLLGIHGFTKFIFDLQGAWWFISLIIQLYLLFPVLWFFVCKFSRAYIFVFIIIMTVSARFIHFANIDSNYSVFAFLASFLFGIYLSKNRNEMRYCIHPFGWTIFCSSTIIIFLVCIYNQDIFIFNSAFGLLRPFVAVGLFMTLFFLLDRFKEQFSWGVWLLANYGVNSYAIFLFHRPLIYKWVNFTSPKFSTFSVLLLFLLMMLPLGYSIETGYRRLLVDNLWRQ